MKTLMALITTTAIGAASLASAQDVNPNNMIAEADVVVELEDAKNANALQFWPQIETDLETVLAQKMQPFYSGEGYDVTIRLTKVSMTGSTLLTDKGEFNHLEGWVYVRNQDDPDPVDSFKVIISAETGTAGLSEGMYLLPGLADFYVALLNGFADKTVREIQDI